MSLIVTLFVMTLVTQCWTAPQRRNWTPQAMLYLKGAQGHRSVLERTSREEDDTVHLVTPDQSSGGLGLSLASSVLLELLQRAVVKGGGTLRNYPDEQELNLNYL
ncbi:spexin-like [Seriola dumerili]|uniref:spexin-like n=1 Tax=Seriola dumerili TaxID=41447 RepID=UPI000BBE102A|nr:spexin-like [Seriola dumerili]